MKAPLSVFIKSKTLRHLTPTTAAKFLRRSSLHHGSGTPGPGASPTPGAHPAQPGLNVRFRRVPIGLSLLFCHASVPGTWWYLQHPDSGSAGEWERDRDVSKTETRLYLWAHGAYLGTDGLRLFNRLVMVWRPFVEDFVVEACVMILLSVIRFVENEVIQKQMLQMEQQHWPYHFRLGDSMVFTLPWLKGLPSLHAAGDLPLFISQQSITWGEFVLQCLVATRNGVPYNLTRVLKFLGTCSLHSVWSYLPFSDLTYRRSTTIWNVSLRLRYFEGEGGRSCSVF